MSKQAKVITKNFQGKHVSGAAERATMELRAGEKGTGKKLHSVEYWPWSSPSVGAAYDAMHEVADKAGYTIV